LQTVSAYKENFAIQNNIRKNKFITELQSYDDRRDNLRKQLTEYQNILDSYKKEILQGQLSVINYLTVVKTMMTVKRDLILLDTNSLLLTNAYNYWNW
jgi:outer membrane protein TolC